MKKKLFIGLIAILLVTGSSALASHAWGNYHWARTTSTFTLKLGDNVSGTWDSVLRSVSSDWSASTVLDTQVVSGLSNPRNCKPVWGRIEVCNNKYGNNGWLGIAQVWLTGGNHITQAVTKLNDTYFNTPTYNTLAWRNLVMCQEVGHTFGLDHQDEDFYNANLGTCMDYTSNPSTNQHPNAHDFAMLEAIYSHIDEGSTLSQTTAKTGNKIDGKNDNLDDSSSWGKVVGKDKKGRDSVFEKDLGKGEKVVTHVFWVE